MEEKDKRQARAAVLTSRTSVKCSSSSSSGVSGYLKSDGQTTLEPAIIVGPSIE